MGLFGLPHDMAASEQSHYFRAAQGSRASVPANEEEAALAFLK